MTNLRSAIPLSVKEVIFQVILHAVVFTFYSYDRDQPEIELNQVIFFLNYGLAALIINYLGLPRFFFRKKYVHFTVFTIAVLLATVVIDEWVLEQIFYPETRAKYFRFFQSLLAILPILAILSGFKFAWDAIQKQREVEELQATVANSELQFLKSQINPHFLFNNLNNLYSYAIENSPKTPEIILELSAVLRYMLYDCSEQYVLLSKEIEQLRNFTKLYELQIEDRGTVNFEADDLTTDFRIAPLILIVFIENAFKHSQSCQSENISIDIRISTSEKGMLDFSCINSFKHIANNENVANGIGLENVRKRLELIYPKAHTLKIKEEANRYEVQLSIQLNSMV